MLNKTSKEMEAVMIAKVTSLHLKSKPHFRRQDIKLAFILQFIARGRELKRLQRIGKEFEDFVMHSHRKRHVFECIGAGYVHVLYVHVVLHVRIWTLCMYTCVLSH